MKYIWEEKDIISGLYVIKNDCFPVKDNPDYARTVTFKIGFDNYHKDQYGMSNCLTDGWYRSIGTKENLTRYLNDGCYRPLSKSEYLLMIESTNQGFYNS